MSDESLRLEKAKEYAQLVANHKRIPNLLWVNDNGDHSVTLASAPSHQADHQWRVVCVIVPDPEPAKPPMLSEHAETIRKARVLADSAWHGDRTPCREMLRTLADLVESYAKRESERDSRHLAQPASE